MASTDVNTPLSSSLRGVPSYVSSAALCELLELEEKEDESSICATSFVASSPSSATGLSSSPHITPSFLQPSVSIPLSSSVFPFVTRMTSSSIQQRGSAALHFVIPSLFSFGVPNEANGCTPGAYPPTRSRVKTTEEKKASNTEVEAVRGRGQDRNARRCESSPFSSLHTHPRVSLREEYRRTGGFSGTISNTAFSSEKGYFSPQRPWTIRMKREAGVKVAQQMFLQEYCPLSSPSISSWRMKVDPSPSDSTPSTADSSLSFPSLFGKENEGYHRQRKVLRLHPFFLRQVALQVLTLLQTQQQQEELCVAHARSSSSDTPKRSLSRIWLIDCTPTTIRFAVLPNGVVKFPSATSDVFRLVFLTGAEWKKMKRSNEENRNAEREASRLCSLPLCRLCCGRSPLHRRHRCPKSQEDALCAPHASSPHRHSCDITTAVPRVVSSPPSAGGPDASPSSAPSPEKRFPLPTYETQSVSECEERGKKRSRELSDAVPNTAGKETGLECSVGYIARTQERWKAVVGAFQLLKEKKKATKEERTGTPSLRLRYHLYWEPTEDGQVADNAKRCRLFSSPLTTAANASPDKKEEEKTWWDHVNRLMTLLVAYEVKRECGKGKSDAHWVPNTSFYHTSVKSKEDRQEMGESEPKDDPSEENTEVCTTPWAIIQNVSWFSRLASPLLSSHSPNVPRFLSSSPTIRENVRDKSVIDNNEKVNISSSKEKIILEEEEKRDMRNNVDPSHVDKKNGSILESTAHEGACAVPDAGCPPLPLSVKSPTPEPPRASHCRLAYTECMEGEGRNWSFSLFTFAAHLSWCEFIMDTLSILPSFSNEIRAGVKPKNEARSVSTSGTKEIGGGTPSSTVISREESISTVMNEEFADFLILLGNPSDESTVPLPASPSNQQSISRRRKWASFLVLSFVKKIKKSTFPDKEAKQNENVANYPLEIYANEEKGMEEEEEMRKCFVIIKVDGCNEILQWCIIQDEIVRRCQIRLQSVEEKEKFFSGEPFFTQNTALHISSLHQLLFFLKQ